VITIIKNPVAGWTLSMLADTALVRKIILGEINKNIVTDYGFRIGLEKDPDVTEDLKLKEREFIWRKIVKDEISDQIDVNESSTLKYYQEHKDNYTTDRKSDVIEILVSSKSLSDSLRSLIIGGSDMSSLAVRFSERTKVEQSLGILKDITKSQLGVVGKIIYSMSLGELSEPIKVGNLWSLVKVIAISPPEYKPLESIKSSVISDFRRDEKRRLTEAYEGTLQNKYNPQYFFGNLDVTVASENNE